MIHEQQLLTVQFHNNLGVLYLVLGVSVPPLVFAPCNEPSLHTVFIAVPVVPQVVTYVNETDTLNLACSNVITLTPNLDYYGYVQSWLWLDPSGNTISASSTISLPSISRTAAGNYTCVTKVIPNLNGVTNVTASTLVVVYCECPPYCGNMFLMFPLFPQTLPT